MFEKDQHNKNDLNLSHRDYETITFFLLGQNFQETEIGIERTEKNTLLVYTDFNREIEIILQQNLPENLKQICTKLIQEEGPNDFHIKSLAVKDNETGETYQLALIPMELDEGGMEIRYLLYREIES